MSSELVFHYNYSAQQNKEVQSIRDKYLPRQENGLDELKRLDRKVESAGMIPALVLGIVSCLVFGAGMCFAMQVIGSIPYFSVSKQKLYYLRSKSVYIHSAL